MKTTRLRVTLREVEPKVERVIDVPAAITLDDLHDVLQVAIGWTDSHLHEFRTEEVRYAPAYDWDPAEDDEVEERGVALSSLPTTFVYGYDFGDGWEHDIDVVGEGGDRPGCVAGEGSCPPEDCGGPHGYAELLKALADPQHPEHERLGAWVGDDLRPFDQDATTQRVRDAVGVVPESVTLLFELLADGVKLTPSGRLPRVVVRAMQEHRADWYLPGWTVSFEEHLYPLFTLHHLLRRVRLLRLSNGVLRPTKAAADEIETVRRLRSSFAPRKFSTVVAERAVALLEARGPMRVPELAEEVFPLMGHGWRRGSDPMTSGDIAAELRHLGGELQALDLVREDGREWSAGRSARSLLPAANLLADLV